MWIACGLLLGQGSMAIAQDSLKELENDLDSAKQQHDDVTSQLMTNYFGQVDAGMGSADAAVRLYEQASLPPRDPSDPAPDLASESMTDLLSHVGIQPTPVIKLHDDETESEKEARLATDQANLTKLGVAVQLQCGLLHYGALFVTTPDQKGLKENFTSWLKTAAQIYPQLAMPPQSADQPDDSQPKKKHKRNGNDSQTPQPKPAPYNPADIKGTALHDSKISKFLGFKLWGDKEQGQWTVGDIPKLYRTNVLDPLRATPTAATLAAWDVYIAMANADEVDNDRWSQSVYPPLQFDRACDDYAVSPDTEKLENLVSIIKANPTYPKVDDWIAQARKLMADYRARHGGAPESAPTPATTTTPTSDPNVSVTTVQQGDAQVIITRTNAAPVTPAPPAR
jgi:hypothetical protein